MRTRSALWGLDLLKSKKLKTWRERWYIGMPSDSDATEQGSNLGK